MTDCPSCRNPLRLVLNEGREFNVCDRCRGFVGDASMAQSIRTGEPTGSISAAFGVDLENYKCRCCSSRNFTSYESDSGSNDAKILACDACHDRFIIVRADLGEMFVAPNSTNPSENLQSAKDDTVFNWLGEVLSAISCLTGTPIT